MESYLSDYFILFNVIPYCDLQTMRNIRLTSKHNPAFNEIHIEFLINGCIPGYVQLRNINKKLLYSKLKKWYGFVGSSKHATRSIENDNLMFDGPIYNNYPDRFLGRTFYDKKINTHYSFNMNVTTNNNTLFFDIFKINFDQNNEPTFTRIMPNNIVVELLNAPTNEIILNVVNHQDNVINLTNELMHIKNKLGAACAMTFLYGDMYVFGGLVQLPVRGAPPIKKFTNNFVKFKICHVTNTFMCEIIGDQSVDKSYINEKPRGRWGHTMVTYVDHKQNEFIIIYGGSFPGQTLDDIWIWTPTHGFLNMTIYILNNIKGRGGHSATILGDYMYVYGGNNHEMQTFGDFHKLNMKELTAIYIDIVNCKFYNVDCVKYIEWLNIEMPNENALVPSIGIVAMAVSNLIIFQGGRDVYLSDVELSERFQKNIYIFNTVTNTWTEYTDIPRKYRRTGHLGILSSDGIIYYGGLGIDDILSNQSYRFDFLKILE